MTNDWCIEGLAACERQRYNPNVSLSIAFSSPFLFHGRQHYSNKHHRVSLYSLPEIARPDHQAGLSCLANEEEPKKATAVLKVVGVKWALQIWRRAIRATKTKGTGTSGGKGLSRVNSLFKFHSLFVLG